jgi:muramoyltetrapeptide carboxypeptidase
LQCYLLDKLGLPAFHGPMVAADFYLEDGVHLESFQAAIAGRPYTLGRAEGLRTLKGGSARGTLYGGCLSILVAMIGTRWEPQTEGKLLFLEDVGAKPYQIDRMLWHLRQAGKLDGIRGIIFGEMLDCASPGAPDDLLENAILSALAGLDVPIALGLRSGHVSRQNVTLTFGVEAELQAGDEAQLALLELAVKS